MLAHGEVGSMWELLAEALQTLVQKVECVKNLNEIYDNSYIQLIIRTRPRN
jgi:hypothetical protein